MDCRWPHLDDGDGRPGRLLDWTESVTRQRRVDTALQPQRNTLVLLLRMATFLLDRAQRVKLGNEYSHSGHPNGGIPQGTLSGPKCFLVYINDLRTTVPLYKYVDDSTLFEICDRNDVSVIQESVDIAARWTEQNDMKINSEKSKEIIISFVQVGNFRSTIPNIKIAGRDIAQVCHAKLLGVTISQDLTWNKHMDNIVKKAGKR